MPGFIGVHVGAGQHSGALEKKYEQLCKQASKHGVDVLGRGGSAVDAVTEVTMLLEDSPLTNAGYGSNLSWDGKVECDASIMDGAHMTFGACGAVAGVKNPVVLARHICDQQRVPLSLGLIPPCLLAGEGAFNYALEHNIATVDPDLLISAKAVKTYKQCKKKLAKYENRMKEKRIIAENNLSKYQEHLDTVGAVCVDDHGNIAVACSSGGVLLKRSGRIGQAAIQGAGCWADNTVGAVSTGCGEHLMATSLAREAVRSIHASTCPTIALRTTFVQDFLESPQLRGVDEKLAGLLVVQVYEDRGELLYGHTTDSMCIGYMATNQKKPKSRMSRLPPGSKHGHSVMIEGICF